MSEYFDFQNNKRHLEEISSYAISSHMPYENCDKERALKIFKHMIGSSINFALKDKSCCNDDRFLNRFLHARKFRCNEAFDLLIKYMEFKQRNIKLFRSLNIFDGDIQFALRDGNPYVLKERDRRGRKIILFSTSNWETSKYTFEDIYRAFMMSLDKLLENQRNQALGFVVIVDCTNFTSRQTLNVSPRIFKVMIEGLQNSFPAKFKGIHFISQPWYVETGLEAIKPFLSNKLQRRIKLHGNNLASLHECISKDILPPELGGEGPNLNALDWYHYLLQSSQNLEPEQSYRLIQTTNYSKVHKP